jgi:hypothetical protein
MICCLLMIFATGSIAKAQTNTADSIAKVPEDMVAGIVEVRDTAFSIAEIQDMVFDVADMSGGTSVSKTAMRELRHEIAIFGGGGMSVLNYSLDKGGSRTDGTDGISGLAGISYTWNINARIGIATGLEIAGYGAKTTYDAVSNEKAYGTDRDKFYFEYKINNYIEEQSIVFFTVPVMLQYSVPLSETKKFYLSGGLKAGFPVNAKATIFPGAVNTSGRFEFEHQTYEDDAFLEEYGFFSNLRPGSLTSDIDTNISLAASLETGVQFRLYKNILLYTGAYFDLGLNNIRSTDNRDLITYQDPSILKFANILKFASVLNTEHINNVRILGAGLKVKVAFGW